ncbi:uncharacterized protein LOC126737865 [Anthonomus grandis grandis]|uniref:uncharacterized protein LOC126737865 n=1 Tax=Anthonomus grandis grandis TaxID=2921223 RepID=UPI0021668EDF|nr:uncharacterized protein LOC126737865 [Anthonomus grandis grandis]
MPKHSRKRQHSRCRSKERKNRRLEKRLAEMQRQLDEINSREKRRRLESMESSRGGDDGEPSAYSSPYDSDLSPRHSVRETVRLDVHQLNSDSEQQENNPQPPIVQSEEAKEKSLSSEVLQILGDEPINKTVLGPPIYEAVVPRWSNILQNGLSEENIQVLLQKHIIPENFKSLEVPQLNLEVRAALTAQILRRDERLVRKQQFVAASISAISQALTLLLAEEGGGATTYICNT